MRLLALILLLIATPIQADIFLLRHAEVVTSDNPDPPLSTLGEQRAAALAKVLAAEKPAAVFTTPYVRTRGTAAPIADAAITLACPGPAPLWPGDSPGQPLAPRPTGNAVFNYPSSMLFAPVVTVPMLSVGGLPVGLQVMGQQQSDARMTATARWILDSVTPVAVS